jgi:two-component system sensor histidine kinase MtrB
VTSLPVWLVGLRARLVLTLIVVAVVSGGAAAGASYVSARRAVLSDAQDRTLNEIRGRLDALAPTLRFPLDARTILNIHELLTGGVLGGASGPRGDVAVAVIYSGTGFASGPYQDVFPSEDLRRAVRKSNHMMWQRVKYGGRAYLGSATPVVDARGLPSGLVVYVLSDLSGLQRSLDSLAWSAGRALVYSLLAAFLLALIAARGVLRPVHNLGQAARRLAAGEFHTRLTTRGSDELADLTRTFNDMAAALEGSVQELRRMETNARRFVADVSHELRTPLAAMTAVTDTLDDEADRLGGDAGTAARLVGTGTRRLADLVENLIEISRFDAGQAVLRIDDDVDVAVAVGAALAARGWTDQVEVDLPPGIHAPVDCRRFDLIVANLVGNAVHHGAPPVEVKLLADVDALGMSWVTVVISDHGPGLAPEVRRHLFERFFKADVARTRSAGSGLGLAIALENARLHGGTIEPGNRPEGGAVFLLRLPGKRPAPEAG